jgi:cation diffusion facilitator family transporter
MSDLENALNPDPLRVVARAESTNDHAKHAMSAVLVAMLANAVIAFAKLGVGFWVTKSTALIAEGLHSLADAFNSVTLLIGLIQGKRPSDRSRPYGYGLETNLWALLASFILFISALVSVIMGWQRLQHPPEILENAGWGVFILVLSVIFEVFALSAASRSILLEVGENAGAFQLIPTAFRHIKKVKSPTTRFVFFEDSVALLGALIALSAILLGESGKLYGWLPFEMSHWPDAIASIVIGVLLLILAINLFSYNRSFLTGVAASAGVEDTLQELILETNGISAIIDFKTMDQGINGLFAQLKVEVEPDIPIRDVDDIIEHLKTRMQKRVPTLRDVIVEVVADESEEHWKAVFHKLIDEAENKTLIRPSEAKIFKNVFDFSECQLWDVMIPRTDVIMAEVGMTVGEVADLLVEYRHSKLPVYKETVDCLVGLVHERDVLKCLREGHADFPLLPLLRDMPIYPENKVLSDILEDFKRDRFQMAAIVDEHGGFAGMVTISDVVEELVGALWEDEEEAEEVDLLELSPVLWQVAGKYEIEDLNETLDISLPVDEFQTVAGFVFGLLGREPQVQDAVQFEDFTFTVQELEGLRIKTLQLASPYPLERKTA